MELREVIGRRRSIRFLLPYKPVEPEKIQRMLEAARIASHWGNVQSLRAVVVFKESYGIGAGGGNVTNYYVNESVGIACGLFIAALLVLLCAPVLAGAVSWPAGRQLGLAPWLAWPPWAETLLLFVLLDGWMYLWHRANHTISLLWRFHQILE